MPVINIYLNDELLSLIKRDSVNHFNKMGKPSVSAVIQDKLKKHYTFGGNVAGAETDNFTDEQKKNLIKAIKKQLKLSATNTNHGILNSMLKSALETGEFDGNTAVYFVAEKYNVPCGTQ